MAKIKVLIKYPWEEIGHTKYISPRLEYLWKVIGDTYIKEYDIGGGIVILAGETAKVRGLNLNFRCGLEQIFGKVIVCGKEGLGRFSDIPISREMWASFLKQWGKLID